MTKTERLTIRPLTFDDAAFILRLSAVMAYARDRLGAKRVAAIVNEDNEPSIKLLVKLGFEANGMIRIPGTNEDVRLLVSVV